MNDPYQVLGIGRSASSDEIKRAYRNLSRKYHPDANINNPNKSQAEERFKEIQQAYRQIMEERENGSYGSYNQTYGGYSYNGQGMGGYNSSANDVNSMHLKAAANYINSRYYKEALNVLAQMEEKNGQWYYLSAIANMGLGNNILALEHAKQAALMEPQNPQFAQLVARLESGGMWYQSMQSPYGTPAGSGSNACAKLCMAYMACNICMSGSMCCNMGHYYPPYW
ncbi:MAG: DnaJ domain-containing protein [Lachnospiraceae bacterium]